MRDTPRRGWIDLARQQRPGVGPVEHVAVGRCTSGPGSALDLLGPSVVGACLWAAGRGLPDEVVARIAHGADGVDRQAEAVLSWDGLDAEVLVATGVVERQWLVVTGALGELEVRPAPFDAVDGEVWASDGTGTERLAFDGTALGRLADDGEVTAVLTALRASAAQGGAPVTPS